MRSSLTTLTVTALIALIAMPCDAKPRNCRTAPAACADPNASARQSAMIFSQHKISNTAHPLLPVDDAGYRYPNDLLNVPGQPAPRGGSGGASGSTP